MTKHSDWVVELKDSGLDEALLSRPADDFEADQRFKLIFKSQYKLENQGLYIAHYASYDDADQTFDADEPYDTFLEHDIKDYLAHYDEIKAAAKRHFHQTMTMGYLIDYYIAKLHRYFEDRQSPDSLVLVNGYEKEID